MYQNLKHKEIVENRGDDYRYIGSYKHSEITIDGKSCKNGAMIRVRCPFCGSEYDVRLIGFRNGNKCTRCCNSYINSFAYHIEVELGENLNDYWDWEKNNELNISPYYISKATDVKNSKPFKVWVKCAKKDYHDSYPITPFHFYEGNRCPQCRGFKIHPKDSFGSIYPSKAKYWSKNNDKSPYEVPPKSGDTYKFICEKCGKEFERNLNSLNAKNCGVFCRDCNNSELEETTKRILQKYNKLFIPQKTFNNLLGLGGGNLSYDFYLPDYNLLIECQGIQHESYTKGFHKTKKDFERQLEHDKRKREYSKQHNIKLLEIWYYDMNNIEDILIKELNLEYRN